jgi:hypothetical protein
MRTSAITLASGSVLSCIGARAMQLTLVLRSTHSSQLRVGLLRFCFFLGGASPWVPVALVVDGSGLVEGCVLWSSILVQRRVAIGIARELGPSA